MLFSALGGIFVAVAAFYFRQSVLLIAISLVLLLVALAIFQKDGAVLFAVVGLLAVAVSAMQTYARVDSVEPLSGQKAEALCTVLENPVDHGNGYSAVVSATDSAVLPDGCRIRIYAKEMNVRAGDRFRAAFKLQPITPAYRMSGYAERIYILGKADELQTVPVGDNRLTFVQKIRDYIASTLSGRLPEAESATLTAILTGDRSRFSERFLNAVRGAGVSHVMVVSGMHLAILMGGLFSLLERFVYNRYVRAAVSVIAVVLLMAICGFTMSVMRAGITYLLTAFSYIVGRDSDSVNTLSATVTLVLIGSPFAVFNLAFQLSVLSTFGILTVAPFVTERITRLLRHRSVLGSAVLSGVIYSLSALLMTLPVTISAFGYVSVVAPLTNLLVSAAVSFSLLTAAAGLLCSLLPFGALLCRPLFLAAGLGARYINSVILSLGELSLSTLQVPAGAVPVLTIAVFVILVIRRACKRHDYLVQLRQLESD